jgi:hypothetical protein
LGNTVAIHTFTTVGTDTAISNSGMAIIIGANLAGSIFTATGASVYTYYRNVIQNGSAIPDYTSLPSKSLFPGNTQTLNLPIKETPEFHDNNPANWFDVGAIPGPDSVPYKQGRAILEAGMVGKTTLWLPMSPGATATTSSIYGGYKIGDTLRIPKNIRKIFGTETFLNTGSTNFRYYSNALNPAKSTLYIVVDQGDSNDYPLIIEGMEMGLTIVHNCTRAIAIKHTNVPLIKSGPNPGDIYFEDVLGFFNNQEHRRRVWARQFNSETLTEGHVDFRS